MLEDDGGEALHRLGDALGCAGADIGDDDAGRAGDHAAEAGEGQAAFRADDGLSRQIVDADVHIGLEGLAGLVEALDADGAAVNPHLGRGDADPVLRRVLDRIEHLVQKSLQQGRGQLGRGEICGDGTEDGAVLRHHHHLHEGILLLDDLPFLRGKGAAGAAGGRQQQRGRDNRCLAGVFDEVRFHGCKDSENRSLFRNISLYL